ncbi:MAG: flagellin [Deltaproteobacteria bacterium]|nr:MAG: flagellin [Deltaproteobacteria bacterium]
MAMQPITLTGGMRANLVSLQNTNSMMETTQKRLASGKKVNSALDDPVAYFTALAHEQRATDLASRKDEMSEAVQTVKAADAGIQSINTLIAAAKSLASAALSYDGTGTTATDAVTSLHGQYKKVLDQISAMATDSGYKGVNLLSEDGELTVKFNERGTEESSLTMEGFDASYDGDVLDLLDAEWLDGDDAVDADAIDDAITNLDLAKEELRTQSSTLSNNLSIITARQEFTQGMINVLKDGAAGLTNADMNEEGANMLMLQTRQALGTTSLSLASQAAQSVLRLF